MIYIHIPFCRSFCTYCDFYSEVVARSESSFDEFTKAIAAETEFIQNNYAGSLINSGSPDTIYIGGGTPSVLPLSVLESIIQSALTLRQSLWLPNPKGASILPKFPVEFTIEVNPDDVIDKGKSYFVALKELGVNRVSMGVQSFNDKLLHWMNRRHSASEAVKAYEILRSAGFENISIDLISGISGLTNETWEDSIEKAIALSPEHISAYQLSIEPGSALAKLVRCKKYEDAPQEQCRVQYYMLSERLVASGYHHYEISNYAKPGYEAIHNGAYWKRVPYVGLGPGAHALLPSLKERQWNPDNIKSYFDTAKTGSFVDFKKGEFLTDEEVNTEKIMLALRTDRGISKKYLLEHSSLSVVNKFENEGVLIESKKTSPFEECSLRNQNHGVLQNGVVQNGVVQNDVYLHIAPSELFTSDAIIAELI